MSTRDFSLSKRALFLLVSGLIAYDGVQSFVVSTSLSLKTQRPLPARSYAAGGRLRMAIEPVVTLLLSADTALPLSDMGDQAADVMGAAVDVAETTQAYVGDSLGSVSDFVGSIIDTINSAKDQVTGATLGSIDALRTQAGELGQNILTPFQRLGGDISNNLFGGLGSLKEGARGAVEGAQSQIGQSVTDTITTPLQDGLSQVVARVLGTSPDEVVKSEESWTMAVQEALKGLEVVATPSTVFYAENAAILPLWLAMIVWPEKPLTKTVMSSYAPLVVAALVYLWLTYESIQNPVSLEGFSSGINLAALTRGFSEETTVAVAWAHFLAQDLFVGRWVYIDGQRNGIFTRHSLALCFLFGPLGLLSHLLTRTLFRVVKPGIRDIMETGSAPVKPSPSTESKEVLARANKEAASILDKARSEGAAQASSLLEAAETEALDILKGAEVERSALLKVKKTESPGDEKTVVDEKAVAEKKAIENATPVADKTIGDEKDVRSEKTVEGKEDVKVANAAPETK